MKNKNEKPIKEAVKIVELVDVLYAYDSLNTYTTSVLRKIYNLPDREAFLPKGEDGQVEVQRMNGNYYENYEGNNSSIVFQRGGLEGFLNPNSDYKIRDSDISDCLYFLEKEIENCKSFGLNQLKGRIDFAEKVYQFANDHYKSKNLKKK